MTESKDQSKTIVFEIEMEHVFRIFELKGKIDGAFYDCMTIQRSGLASLMEDIVESYTRLVAKPIEDQILGAMDVKK